MHLTYRTENANHLPVSTNNLGEAGAPAIEIEITPAMIEAGALALSKHDAEFESSEEAVARIFRAMLAAPRTRLPA